MAEVKAEQEKFLRTWILCPRFRFPTLREFLHAVFPRACESGVARALLAHVTFVLCVRIALWLEARPRIVS